uniref:NAD(P)(+)--arginine ADP-ribosyltransferase n=2 Tax=Echeneis naucrates TaxID=173247 RepID=A0A665V1Q4_ECHNA
MKVHMLLFASLCLLLCFEPPVDSVSIHLNRTRQDATPEIPLDMFDNSVDDMYFGCKKEMMERVNSLYSKERYTPVFADVWNKAADCAEEKLKQKEDAALTKDHLQAICVYTSNYSLFYKKLNDAVRTKGESYGSSFPFHSLHFLLTSAIQILNNNYECHTTYRRNNIRFSGQINQIIRFGFFASSSYKPDLEEFGHQTCFKIKTCSGAYLKNYSVFVSEAEVLIPPYEMFKITGKIAGKNKIQKLGLKSCNSLYVLESVGCKSTLNCKAALK